MYTGQTDTNVLIGRIGLILQGKLKGQCYERVVVLGLKQQLAVNWCLCFFWSFITVLQFLKVNSLNFWRFMAWTMLKAVNKNTDSREFHVDVYLSFLAYNLCFVNYSGEVNSHTVSSRPNQNSRM